MKIKGTETEKNILEALKGESLARNKYTYYAEAARRAGNEQIATLFDKMADNEKEHARIWFKTLNGAYDDIEANLIDASDGEHFEWISMYPDFAKTAREEGFELLASMFERIAAIENDHDRRFQEALLSLRHGSDESEGTPQYATKYRCIFCGDIESNEQTVCPVCGALSAFEKVTVAIY